MKSFYKFYTIAIAGIVLIFVAANLFLARTEKTETRRYYRVEVNRIVNEIKQNGVENVNLSDYRYITHIETFYENGSLVSSSENHQKNNALEERKKTFYEGTDSDYIIREINGIFYRFDYLTSTDKKLNTVTTIVNFILAAMSLMILSILTYVWYKILKTFHSLREVPYELSRGNLTIPVKESKSRFFGKFVWGINMLRENIEQQKQRELALIHDKKTLVLSISHDIKTPLSAIKLYSQALSKELYKDPAKKIEIAESINEKTDEIEKFISQIIKASNEDFLNLEVQKGEFYLSELILKITQYYTEKLELIRIAFSIDHYSDCILKGDLDRSIEVLQNIIENAVKYGDGHNISLAFSEENDCQLITAKNSGCTLSETELPHIFDSFWRGSNTGNNAGSGLGLAICRQLMYKMNGDIFAEIQDNMMCVTLVFGKAGG